MNSVSPNLCPHGPCARYLTEAIRKRQRDQRVSVAANRMISDAAKLQAQEAADAGQAAQPGTGATAVWPSSTETSSLPTSSRGTSLQAQAGQAAADLNAAVNAGALFHGSWFP